MCALFALKLCKDDSIKDFQMTSNNKKCGVFNDIEVKITFNDGKNARFCFQLKHNEKSTKKITKEHLEAEKGDFAVKKYFESMSKMKMKEKTTCILFTNCLKQVDDNFQLSEMISVEKIEEWKYGYLFFNCQQENSTILKIRNNQNDFYLIINQDNVEKTKTDFEKTISSLLDCQISNQFVEYMREWWAGRFVLFKHDVICKLTQLALLPYVLPLTNNKANEKTKFIRESINQFPITTVEENQGIIENIWDNLEIDATNENYSKAQNKFKTINKWETLWYLDEVPLVVKVDDSRKQIIKKVLALLHNNMKDKKLIFIGNLTKEEIGDWECFNNLSDVIDNSQEITQQILDNFKISLQGKQSISLRDLIGIDKNIAKLISIDNLLTMTQNDYLKIGTATENDDLVHVKQKVFENSEQEFEETEVMKIFDDSLNVICAPPGMGKSTLMKVLARNAPPTYWCVNVKLIQFNSIFATDLSFNNILHYLLHANQEDKISKFDEKDKFGRTAWHLFCSRKVFFHNPHDYVNMNCEINWNKQLLGCNIL